jgi:predicted DCC family thiol-disulfide oxidoreductase YuxK
MVYKAPQLTVFYDGDCPLCNRTAVIIDHFDIFRGVLFKDLQTQSGAAAELQAYDEQVLLDDLYAVDLSGKVYSGVDTSQYAIRHPPGKRTAESYADKTKR